MKTVLSSKLHYLPVLMAVYLPVAFCITYGMSVAYEHVSPGFPYISDTGTIPPESCIFGQLLSIYAGISTLCMVIRYKQVRHVLYHQLENKDLTTTAFGHLRRTNMASLVMGLFAALGISLVGNFQETNQLVMHIIGALLAFGVGGLYLWMQWVLNFMYRNGCCIRTGRKLLYLRLVCNIVNTVCFFTMLLATKLSLDVFDGSNLRFWQSHHQGYAAHLVATITEWIMPVAASIYFGTFYVDFRDFKLYFSLKHTDGCQDSGRQTNNIALT